MKKKFDDGATAPQVIIAMDSEEACRGLGDRLRQLGCAYRNASNYQELTSTLASNPCTLTIIDVDFDGGGAIEYCQQHPRLLHDVPVVFHALSGESSLKQALHAMKAGGKDVLVPPFDADRLLDVANLARLGTKGERNGATVSGEERHQLPGGGLAYSSCNSTNGAKIEFGREVPNSCPLENMLIGCSGVMRSLRRLIREVAQTRATVMVHGESGTGKELVAKAIHLLSGRAGGQFVPVNMAAIPQGLAESLLFGHVKGAFTSAHAQQQGWCEAADGGTLFLDEIGEVELPVQPKLLRFLQEGTVQAVGSGEVKEVDVRIVTATNRDPHSLVQEGLLREDLYFRLHVVPVHLPPLRDRREDIDELVRMFVAKSTQAHDRRVLDVSNGALELLRNYSWPGNVRQLENLVERAVIFSRGDTIQAEDVPAEVHSPISVHPTGIGNGADNESEPVQDWGNQNGMLPSHALTTIQQTERAAIISALQRSDGHVVDAARLLGLGQATVYRKIKKYAIPHQRWRRRAK